MKTIAIIAGTINGNKGAEAMLVTAIFRIRDRFPDARFNVFSYYPKEDQELLAVDCDYISIFDSTPFSLLSNLFPGSLIFMALDFLKLDFLKKFLPAPVKALSDSDILLDIAGVSFIDGREKFLPFNILTILPAYLVKTPVVKISQALGPFEKKINYLCAKIFLGRCQMIFARGEHTLRNLKRLGIDQERFVLAPDIAFLHQENEGVNLENVVLIDKTIDNLETKKKREGKKLVGFCPSAVLMANHPNYTKKCKKIIENLINSEYLVLLFPNATRSNTDKLRNNDLPVIGTIIKSLSPQYKEYIFYIDFDLNTNGIKKLICRCDVLIVSRFHAMVAALSLCKPVIVLGWSHKYLEVMEQFNLEKYVFDYQRGLDPETITLIIKKLLDDFDANKIKTIKKKISKMAEIQIAYIEDSLCNLNNPY